MPSQASQRAEGSEKRGMIYKKGVKNEKGEKRTGRSGETRFSHEVEVVERERLEKEDGGGRNV